MTDYNDEKWHGWNGGECPVHPKSVVEAVWMSGGPFRSEQRKAGDFRWDAPVSKIVAFRVVKEYRVPREWWINTDSSIARKYDPHAAGWVHVREVVEGGDA